MTRTHEHRPTLARGQSLAHWAACAVILGASAGCTGPEGCAEGACPTGSRCSLSGVCGPLAERDGFRFAQADRLPPVDWGATRADARGASLRDVDRWLLGGSVKGRVHLAFRLPDRDLVEAVLTMFAAGEPPSVHTRLLPFRSAAFAGAELDRQTAPRVRARGHARRVMPRAGDPVRIDLTPLLRDHRGEVVYVGLGAGGPDQPLLVSSPLALDEHTHPYLDVRSR